MLIVTKVVQLETYRLFLIHLLAFLFMLAGAVAELKSQSWSVIMWPSTVIGFLVANLGPFQKKNPVCLVIWSRSPHTIESQVTPPWTVLLICL